MKRIQNKKDKIGTYEINKRSLPRFDDHTLAYFYKDLKKQILAKDHKDSQRWS